MQLARASEENERQLSEALSLCAEVMQCALHDPFCSATTTTIQLKSTLSAKERKVSTVASTVDALEAKWTQQTATSQAEIENLKVSRTQASKISKPTSTLAATLTAASVTAAGSSEAQPS